MTFVSQDMSVCYLASNSPATGLWSATKNLRWARRLSHLGGAICITASTSVLARSFTTRDARTVCTEDRWKKFLSLISHADSAFGCDRTRHPISTFEKSSAGHDRAWGKDASAIDQ
jgi:hypothetical protein